MKHFHASHYIICHLAWTSVAHFDGNNKDRRKESRLPLVGEITYNRGNEVFAGGRGNLLGKGNKIG